MPEAPHEVSIPKRAWRDAKAIYRTFWFIVPAGLVAIAAAWMGVALPEEDTGTEVRVLLAGLSAPGGAALLGFLVLMGTLIAAPIRRWCLRMDARLDQLEARVADGGSATTASPPVNVHIAGGGNTINMPPSGTDVDQARVEGGSAQQELQLEGGENAAEGSGTSGEGETPSTGDAS